jgi:hypothetical protein
MTTRHSFTMEDFDDEDITRHSTRIEMNFETEELDGLVEEFLSYLWHCGFTYVENIEVTKKIVT